MKTTFTCEVCGKTFTDWEECHNHEKACQEEHATGFRITKELTNLLKQAQAACVPVVLDCHGDPVHLDEVRYNPDKKRIYMAFTD